MGLNFARVEVVAWALRYPLQASSVVHFFAATKHQLNIRQAPIWC